jgi:hypothetical protein
LKVENERKNKDTSICHRIDLVRIEEGYENLVERDKNGKENPKSTEKTFIIGLDNQQCQAQIKINPYQK